MCNTETAGHATRRHLSQRPVRLRRSQSSGNAARPRRMPAQVAADTLLFRDSATSTDSAAGPSGFPGRFPGSFRGSSVSSICGKDTLTSVSVRGIAALSVLRSALLPCILTAWSRYLLSQKQNLSRAIKRKPRCLRPCVHARRRAAGCPYRSRG